MSYPEDDYLLISGIQHYMFCRRQWALIHIEQQWSENWRTVDGKIMHKNVHDSGFSEKRGNIITVRAMAVSSPRLGITGECDAVEFHSDPNGVGIFGREGRFSAVPIEYKRGSPKVGECDVMQLAAQAMCLEDMLCCEIPTGFLYYGETRHRTKVELTQDIKRRTENIIEEMHRMFSQQHTPDVRKSRSCNACSLKDICLPFAGSGKTASQYVADMLSEEGIL